MTTSNVRFIEAARNPERVLVPDERGILRQARPWQHYTEDELKELLRKVATIILTEWKPTHDGDMYVFSELGCAMDSAGTWWRYYPNGAYKAQLNFLNMAYCLTKQSICSVFLKYQEFTHSHAVALVEMVLRDATEVLEADPVAATA